MHSGQRASEPKLKKVSLWCAQLQLCSPGWRVLGLFPLMRAVGRCFVCGSKLREKEQS